MAAPHRARRLFGHTEEEARADDCFRQRGARPRLPNLRPGKRMNPAIDNAAARQRAGEPSVVPSRGGGRNNRSRNPGTAEVEREIAGLVDRSTHELRLTWREFHRAGP